MFKNARIKLTLWYLLILGIISASFSFVIYRSLTLEIDRFAKIQKDRLERRFQDRVIIGEKLPPPLIYIDPDLIADTKGRIKLILIGINGGILMITGTLSYILSGKTLKPIKQMMEEQNRFVSDASHELRTPLTALKTSIEVGLRDKKLDLNGAKKILKENLVDVNHLSKLSLSLLELSRLDNQTIVKKFEPLKLKNLLNKSISTIQPFSEEKNISLVCKSIFGTVLGDEDKLIELFTIILDNAIKYSPNDKKVIVYTKKSQKYIRVHIVDEGCGIEKNNLEKIFDRFYRADKARTTQGFGLGLSIAKRIIDYHNGHIEVRSQIGNGSDFIISLPRK